VGGDALSPLVDDQHTTYLTKLNKKHSAAILQINFLIAINPWMCEPY
jgi:hypothetical protein